MTNTLARTTKNCVIALLLTSAGAWAQFSPLSPMGLGGTDQAGPRLYSVSGFANYYILGDQYQQGLYPQGPAPLGNDWGLGGSASMGWSKPGPLSRFSIGYSISYIGRLHNSDASGLSHALTISGTRKLSPHWSGSMSINGVLSNYDQYLFTPMQFAAATAVPSTFEDLTSAVLGNGTVTNSQLASLLTGAPIVESPARSLIYGNRVFNASASAGLSYAASPRLNISFQGYGSRIQNLHTSSDDPAFNTPFLIPVTTSAGGSIGMSYAATPRTSVGLNLGTTRSFSSLQDSYANSASVSLGHTFGRRWFGQISGGAAKIVPIRTTYVLATGIDYVASGSLGYKTRSHTFMINGVRSVGDTYAIGSSTTISAGAAWSWHRPGAHWSMMAQGSRQMQQSLAYSDLNGWRAGIAVSEVLTQHLVAQAQYSYLSYSTLPISPLLSQDQNGVMLSLTWYPTPVRR